MGRNGVLFSLHILLNVSTITETAGGSAYLNELHNHLRFSMGLMRNTEDVNFFDMKTVKDSENVILVA